MDEIEKMIDRKEQEDPHPETYVSIAAVRDIGLTNAKKVCTFGIFPGDLRDTCYRCFKKGHVRKDCTRSRTPSDRRKWLLYIYILGVVEIKKREEGDHHLLHLDHQDHQDQEEDIDNNRSNQKDQIEDLLHLVDQSNQLHHRVQGILSILV